MLGPIGSSSLVVWEDSTEVGSQTHPVSNVVAFDAWSQMLVRDAYRPDESCDQHEHSSSA